MMSPCIQTQSYTHNECMSRVHKHIHAHKYTYTHPHLHDNCTKVRNSIVSQLLVRRGTPVQLIRELLSQFASFFGV